MVRDEIKKLWDKYREMSEFNHEALRVDMGLDKTILSDLEIIKFQLFMLDRFCGDQHKRIKQMQGSDDARQDADA